MGARKAIAAEKRSAEKKQKAVAILRDCPTSPRKMRLVADIEGRASLIRFEVFPSYIQGTVTA